MIEVNLGPKNNKIEIDSLDNKMIFGLSNKNGVKFMTVFNKESGRYSLINSSGNTCSSEFRELTITQLVNSCISLNERLYAFYTFKSLLTWMASDVEY